MWAPLLYYKGWCLTEVKLAADAGGMNRLRRGRVHYLQYSPGLGWSSQLFHGLATVLALDGVKSLIEASLV